AAAMRPAARAAFRTRSPLAIGIVNGFLPCPVVASFLAQAAASTSAARGALVMLVLALGTAPPLVLLALGSSRLRPGARASLRPVAGAFLVLFGAATVARGIAPDAIHRAITGGGSPACCEGSR